MVKLKKLLRATRSAGPLAGRASDDARLPRPARL